MTKTKDQAVTAFVQAYHKKSWDAVQSAMKAMDVCRAWNNGDTPLLWVMRTPSEHQVQVVHALLRDLSPFDVQTKDHEGLDALMWAVKQGSLELVKALLPKSDAHSTNNMGETALMIATQWAYLDILEHLLPMSDPNQANGQGQTPLIRATWGSSVDAVTLLLPVSDLGRVDNKGRTARQMAMDNGDTFVLASFADHERAQLQQMVSDHLIPTSPTGRARL